MLSPEIPSPGPRLAAVNAAAAQGPAPAGEISAGMAFGELLGEEAGSGAAPARPAADLRAMPTNGFPLDPRLAGEPEAAAAEAPAKAGEAEFPPAASAAIAAPQLERAGVPPVEEAEYRDAEPDSEPPDSGLTGPAERQPVPVPVEAPAVQTIPAAAAEIAAVPAVPVSTAEAPPKRAAGAPEHSRAGGPALSATVQPASAPADLAAWQSGPWQEVSAAGASDALPERDAHGLKSREVVEAPAPGVSATAVQRPETAPAVAAAADAAPPPSAPPADALTLLGTGGSDWRLDAAGAGADPAIGKNASAATPPREIAQQLTLAIDRAASDRIEIRLDPPELGRVQIELRVEEGRLHAAIVTERPEVQDLMRRHADLLIRELEAAGHGRVSLDFASGSGERQAQGERPPQQTLRAVYDAGAPVTAAAVGPARRAAASGLDIRL